MKGGLSVDDVFWAIEPDDFTSFVSAFREVIKEVARRCELRPQLEAEHGWPLTDEEFIVIADSTGVKV